jgi:DNA polymerase-3 subunit epsilon
MNRNAWLFFLATATLEFGLIALAGWGVWSNLTVPEQAFIADLWGRYAGLPILAGLLLLGLIGGTIGLLFQWYVRPLPAMAEETRVIAMSNPRHRLATNGAPELRDLATSLNLLADRYLALQEEVEVRIRDASVALEDEKNTLATLMAKLTQGVLVCNGDGRILLYNQRAQTLLEGPARRSGVADWIGLGRSVYGVLDEHQVNHALRHIEHRLRQGETGLLAPFVAARPGGQLLSVHLVPVLDREQAFSGYILTLEDITRRTETESRRGLLLRSLTEGQRSAIAGIRAAIEMVLNYPDMDDASRARFLGVIRDESLTLSQHLDRLEADYATDLKTQWPLEQLLGSDLLAILERRLQDLAGADLRISAPLEPLWLQVDSYAVCQAAHFLAGRLRDSYQAARLELTLEHQGAFACLVLGWYGVPLEMETLRAWGQQPVLADQHGASLTLHDVIERHGGEVWARSEPATGRCCLRLLLPLVEGDPLVSTVVDGQGHDYDFQLFNHDVCPLNPFDTPLIALSYTVIDTETTGLNPSAGDEIIAIGAVRIINGRVLPREIFDVLVNPRRPIAEAAIAVHGISPPMLRGMPTIDEVLPRFHRFIEDTVIVGHNVAFDMRFLELKEARLGFRFSQPVLDTLLLACVIHPYQDDKSLEAIADRCGITVTGRHSALGDALTTAEVLLALIPLLAERGIHTLGQAQAACASSHYAQLKY